MTARFLSALALLVALATGIAGAQPTETAVAAGVIPLNLSLDVTGSPAMEPDVLTAQIRAALDREIRPTLRPGAGLRFGAVSPWPLPALPEGSRTAVNVAVSIVGDASSTPVSGTVTVTVANQPAPAAAPKVLFLSDDPEYIQSDGLVFKGEVDPARPARLYYYHSDIGLPRDLDVVLTAAAPSRVQIIESGSGPDLDVLAVGHTVSRDLLRFERTNQGTVIDLAPGKPYVVRHAMMLQGEVVAGAVDMQVLGGAAVTASVVAAPAGSRPDLFLAGPRLPYDGHARHGTFDLADFGAIASSYTIGGPDVAIQYGSRAKTPRNLTPGDPGHDFGDYGIVHQITFTLVNPTDAPSLVYLYEKPLGGPVRSSFFVDGQLKELGCVRMSKPYWIATYQVPPHTTGASTTVTMTDGGSFYPLEFGVTETQPAPYTPRVGTPEGCSPNIPAFPDQTAATTPRRQ